MSKKVVHILKPEVRAKLSAEAIEKYETIIFHGYPYYEANCTWENIRDKLERQGIINVSTDYLAKCFRAYSYYQKAFNPMTGKLKADVLGERASKSNARDTKENSDKYVEEFLASGKKIKQIPTKWDKISPKCKTMHHSGGVL